MSTRIEALEPIKSDGHVIEAGDRVTVPDEVAARWCAAGWARDTTGNLATGERRVVRATVTPHTAAHGQTAGEVTNG